MRRAVVVTLAGGLLGAALATAILLAVRAEREPAERDRAETVYGAQGEGCERGNVLRRELNDRGESLAAYAAAVERDPRVPAGVRDAAADLRRGITPVPVVACAAEFPRP